jgi:hypothetical protein
MLCLEENFCASGAYDDVEAGWGRTVVKIANPFRSTDC